MSRPALEVADIFRDHGAAWRFVNAGHVSLDQMKVMSAIESCRTAALGGHVARCQDCAYTTIAWNDASFPPLRAVRQILLCRQHRAGTQTARHPAAQSRARRCRLPPMTPSRQPAR